MTAYGTIKIPHEDYERHNTKRKELNQTWAEYIDGQEPDPPAVDIEWAEEDFREFQENFADMMEPDGTDDWIPTYNHTLTYGDVRAACRDAIDDVLGED